MPRDLNGEEESTEKEWEKGPLRKWEQHRQSSEVRTERPG